jgi:hypothetical protein
MVGAWVVEERPLWLSNPPDWLVIIGPPVVVLFVAIAVVWIRRGGVGAGLRRFCARAAKLRKKAA